jgi:hypothetical protein
MAIRHHLMIGGTPYCAFLSCQAGIEIDRAVRGDCTQNA